LTDTRLGAAEAKIGKCQRLGRLDISFAGLRARSKVRGIFDDPDGVDHASRRTLKTRWRLLRTGPLRHVRGSSSCRVTNASLTSGMTALLRIAIQLHLPVRASVFRKTASVLPDHALGDRPSEILDVANRRLDTTGFPTPSCYRALTRFTTCIINFGCEELVPTYLV